MEAPKTIEEIWERKALARLRFDRLPLIDQIELMARHRRELEKLFGHDRRKNAREKVRAESAVIPTCSVT